MPTCIARSVASVRYASAGVGNPPPIARATSSSRSFPTHNVAAGTSASTTLSTRISEKRRGLADHTRRAVAMRSVIICRVRARNGMIGSGFGGRAASWSRRGILRNRTRPPQTQARYSVFALRFSFRSLSICRVFVPPHVSNRALRFAFVDVVLLAGRARVGRLGRQITNFVIIVRQHRAALAHGLVVSSVLFRPVLLALNSFLPLRAAFLTLRHVVSLRLRARYCRGAEIQMVEIRMRDL